MTSKKKPKNGSENGRYEKKHSINVMEELRKKGFLLEIIANQTLEKSSWIGNMHRTYWNLPKGGITANAIQRFSLHEFKLRGQMGREIDIFSVKGDAIDHPKLEAYHIKLVIDCKYRFDENWVFYTRPNLSSPPDPSSPLASHLVHEGSCFTYFKLIQRTGFIEPHSNLHKELNEASHQSWSHQLEPARASVSLFRNDKSIFSACQQITDAYDWLLLERLCSLHYAIGRGEKRLEHFTMYPVVVLDGPLWRLRLENEKPMLEKADWVTYYYSKGMKTYAIDFVSWDKFETYLRVLDDELDRIRKILEKTNE